LEAALTTFAPFSPSGNPATAKLLVLGPANAGLVDRSRSLNIEHVSAAELVRQEISRRTPAGRQAEQARNQGKPVPDEAILVPLRKWFWTRKPDAGFVLSDFPATLLQARVFDEWLEARGSALSAVMVFGSSGSSADLIDYYRMCGHDLVEAAAFAA
jgi:adenylate kinase